MQIPSDSLDEEAAYKVVTGAVVPRPIAWVSTISEAGVVNLAPFSAFTFVSTYPPLLGISIGLRTGRLKDTAVNIEATSEYVVNIGDQSMIKAIHQSSADYPPSVSEMQALGLEGAASVRVRPPRLLLAPVSMECRLHQTLSFGRVGHRFVVGEVLIFHVRDDLVANGKIDSAKMRPACRLAGPSYATLGEILTLSAIADLGQRSTNE